jgi:hypothetical protein
MRAALPVGRFVRVTRTIHLAPYTTVLRGETGRVVMCDAEAQHLEVKLDKVHEGLKDFDNCIWSYGDHDDVGVLAALKPDPWPVVRTGLAALSVFTFGMLALCDGSSLWAEGYHEYEVIATWGKRYKVCAVREQDGALRILSRQEVTTTEVDNDCSADPCGGGGDCN